MAYFNYKNLDTTGFEALAKDVMGRRIQCVLFRYGEGKDGGIDLCDDIRTKHIVVQCKNYPAGTFSKLYSVLKNEERPKIDALNPKPEHYYIFTSLELLPQQKLNILDLFQEYMPDESCIVDGVAINEFFRDEHNHDLVPRNIRLFQGFPDNYQPSPADHSQLEKNRLYDRLIDIFENDRKNHPSIRMMDPDPALFPKGLPEVLSDGRFAVSENEPPRPIRGMILEGWKHEDHRHILLVGEGGIGKTVAMLTLPQEDWIKELQISVIYVPLQRLDAFKGDLNRYIRDKIGDDQYSRCIELANSAFGEHPKLLLLLDGFNEIPNNYKRVAAKYIREWMEKPGTQIITTSRLGFFLENNFSKYQLQPLPQDTVKAFLLSAGIAEAQLPGKNDRIWGVINIPLMLTMYTQIEKIREVADGSYASSILDWKAPVNAAHIIWDYLQMELYRCIEKDDSTHSVMYYAVAIISIAPYVCCQMSCQNKYYISKEEFIALVQDAVKFYSDHQEFLTDQIMNICDVFDPYHQEDLFRAKNAAVFANILIDNIGLFQTQIKNKQGASRTLDYTCSLMHQNFRDGLAAFFVCSCLPRTSDLNEKKALLDQADFYVKNYMAEYFSDQELVSIWNRHRKQEPEDGQITYVLMDLIGRQRNYDYRELDFSGVNLNRTNLHPLLSRRVDICPLPEDRNKLNNTIVGVSCFLPKGHADDVASVAFSPDGRLLVSGGGDRTIRIWDLESGESRALEGHEGRVNSVAFSPDGKLLASGADDRTVRIWNMETGESIVLEGLAGWILSVAFSPDGRKVASGSDDNTVRIWDLESRECRIFKGHEDWVNSVAFHPDGQLLASGSEDGLVRIWNLNDGKCRMLKGHEGGINCVAFSPDGRQAASSADDRTVCLWDIESGNCRTLEGHENWVNSVAFCLDGRQLASAGQDGTVLIWDLESGERQILKEHISEINSVAFSPDGRRLTGGGTDGTVRIWDLQSGNSSILEGNAAVVYSVGFSPDGRHLASGASDGLVRILDTDDSETHILEGHEGRVYSVTFNPNGRQLVSSASDGTIRIWDLDNKSVIVLNGQAEIIYSAVFSHDGARLASVASDRRVRLWKVGKWESRVLAAHTGQINSIAFSPDGKKIAFVGTIKNVHIMNLDYGWRHVLRCNRGRIYSIALSPNGEQLACGLSDGTVLIWDVKSRSNEALEGHTGKVSSVAFSPDGRRLASAAYDGTVRIWDLELGEVKILRAHASKVNSVSFDPDGTTLAAGTSEGTILIWDLRTYQEIRKIGIIRHINLSKANFELAIMNGKDKETLRAVGARV